MLKISDEVKAEADKRKNTHLPGIKAPTGSSFGQTEQQIRTRLHDMQISQNRTTKLQLDAEKPPNKVAKSSTTAAKPVQCIRLHRHTHTLILPPFNDCHYICST